MQQLIYSIVSQSNRTLSLSHYSTGSSIDFAVLDILDIQEHQVEHNWHWDPRYKDLVFVSEAAAAAAAKPGLFCQRKCI